MQAMTFLLTKSANNDPEAQLKSLSTMEMFYFGSYGHWITRGLEVIVCLNGCTTAAKDKMDRIPLCIGTE